MIDLERPGNDDRYLLYWNAELPTSGVADPLGLTLRVGARLSDELSYCITSITPRARYYSFFPWAFKRAWDALGQNTELPQVMSHVLSDERAMALGAVLHHGGQPCEGGALQGSNGAQSIASDLGRDPIDLRAWKHLEDKEGGFAAYKGSLINLGVFLSEEQEDRNDDKGDFDEKQTDQLSAGRLSPLGMELARSFSKAVAETAYLQARPDRDALPFELLNEFGGRAGLCELQKADGCDLEPLRSLFFATEIQGEDNSHYRRRMSLLLFMYAAKVADANGLVLSREVIDHLTFYRRLKSPSDEQSEIVITIPEELDDIAERWRVFHFHNYLTVSLESLLAGIARSVRGHPAGLTIEEIVQDFDSADARVSLADKLPLNPTESFWDLTPASTLARMGIETDALLEIGQDGSEKLRSCKMIEHQLRSFLVDEGMVTGPAGPAIAGILLFTLAIRFRYATHKRHQGWNRRKVLDQTNDVSLPGLLDGLESQFGSDWWQRSNRTVLKRVLSRHVIRQHEAMSYERGVGGSPSLFHLEGTRIVGNDINRDDVDLGNARFPSIIQILRDLRLITDQESRQKLTNDGAALLASCIGS